MFVDWNTPDDFPTFPEAILDTLTARARRLMRVLRVRPRDHARFAERTHLLALEPVARNVALRRANVANPWVLSTNTDMIFVPRTGRSLSGIAAGCTPAAYHLPRFELPESLWETLDRSDPAGCIAQVGAWGHAFHLNEVVTLPNPAVRFDGPGDFQLLPRAELCALHGFDERMLVGWHVDSNIAARMALRHGQVRDVADDLYGYHCDHTRQVTPAHRAGAVQNDWRLFVDDVTEAQAPDQPDWGLADAAVEEIRLDRQARRYVAALEAVIAPATGPLAVASYGPESFDRSDGAPCHVAPFLIDALASQPPGVRVGWFATGTGLLRLVAEAWPRLGFTQPIRAVVGGEIPVGVVAADAAATMADADLLVFDFALTDALRADPARRPREDAAMAGVLDALEDAVAVERTRQEAHPPRRFIAVNAVNNTAEQAVLKFLGVATAPYATRLRQGYLRPDDRPSRHHCAGTLDLTPWLLAGAAGVHDGAAVRARPGVRGLILHTSPLTFAAGRYVFEAVFTPQQGRFRPAPVKLAVGPEREGAASVVRLVLGAGRLRLAFTVAAEQAPRRLDLRISGIGWLRGAFDSARVRTLD